MCTNKRCGGAVVAKRTVSRSDVAAIAGVSRQTVSNVVNESGSFTKEMRERVLAAVEATGYRPNPLARGLSTKRAGNVAVLVESLESPYNGGLVAGICRHLAAKGLRSLMVDLSWLDSDYIGSLTQGLVDGVIIAGGGSETGELIGQLLTRQMPVVGQGIEIPCGIPIINADYSGGIRAILTHLQELGHRRVAFVGEFGSRLSGRYSAYLFWRAELGLSTDLGLAVETPHGQEWTSTGGYQATERLLASGLPFTAVVAPNDAIAFGAMKALTEAGRAIPEDVSVVGWDDVEVSAYMNPPLTTLRTDRDALGRRVVEGLLLSIEHLPVDTSPSEGTLVVRGSSGRASA